MSIKFLHRRIIINKEVKLYAKSLTKAKAKYRKYKDTGSKHARKQADYNFGIADALKTKLKHPESKVVNTNISHSFNASKETTYGLSDCKISLRRKSKRIKY